MATVANVADTTLPVLFFDRELPEKFRDLVEGRAEVVGPDDAHLSRAEAVLAGMRRWDAAAMDNAPRLRVISRIGVGYDTVDVEAASARGVTVCFAPHAPTVSTAEHTIALMLAITKEIPAAQQRCAQGITGGPATSLELDGAVLGLLGYGRIATRVAKVALALGMRVVAHDPYLHATAGGPGTAQPSLTPIGSAGDTGVGIEFVELEELWARSAVVSLHAPATADTHHIVSAQAFAMMAPGAYLVNCARGSLVDQDALLSALDTGHLAGAALDVTEPEPLPRDHPLLRMDNAIIAPHLGSATRQTRSAMAQLTVDNLKAGLAGLALPSRIA